MNLTIALHQLFRRRWTAAEIQELLGTQRGTFLGYATDPAVRQNAASGGTTSAILIHALSSGRIDGALVCRTQVTDGKVQAGFVIATTAAQILACRGSKYMESRFVHEALPLIHGFAGRVAVVGLPCHITALSHWRKKDPAVDRKIVFTIGLYCGHNSRRELVDSTVTRLESQAGSPISDYKFRVGHGRGALEATFKNGAVIRRPFSDFGTYQNLHFFSERKCLSCTDHFGYHADISNGDIWSLRYKREPIKHTATIIRTLAGEEIWESATRSGAVSARQIAVTDVLDGQRRAAPAHHDIAGRRWAGNLVGIRVPSGPTDKSTFFGRISALITLVNLRLSEEPWAANLIFRVPRPLLRAYLLLKKGLETVQ